MVDANYFMKANPQEILRMQLTSMVARHEVLAEKLSDPSMPDRQAVAEQLKAAEDAIIAYTTRIAELNAAEDARKRSEEQEDANYWLRRFCTSLAIANAGAFAALAAGFLNTDDKASVAADLATIMTTFAVGTCSAGLIPGWHWLRGYFRPMPSSGLTRVFDYGMGGLIGVSVAYFAGGIILCIKAVASFA